MSDSEVVTAPSNARPRASAWEFITSNKARQQSGLLLFVSAILLAVMDRKGFETRILAPLFISAPVSLGLFLGLVAQRYSVAYATMPRLLSAAIYSLLGTGLLCGGWSSTTTQILAGAVGAVAIAVIASLVLTTLVNATAGEVSTPGDFVSPATFISCAFILLSSTVTAVGLFFWFLHEHYNAPVATYASRLVGRPEVFLMAVPALALASYIVNRASKFVLPTEMFTVPLVLFGLAGLTSFLTRSSGDLRLIRYPGTPFVFPIVLLVVAWVLSLIRGFTKESHIPLASVWLGILVVAVALGNKAAGGTWMLGRLDGSLVGFALLIAIGVFTWLSRELFDFSVPPVLVLGLLVLIALGALLTVTYVGIGVQVFGNYAVVREVTASKVGYFLVTASVVLLTIASVIFSAERGDAA